MWCQLLAASLGDLLITLALIEYVVGHLMAKG